MMPVVLNTLLQVGHVNLLGLGVLSRGGEVSVLVVVQAAAFEEVQHLRCVRLFFAVKKFLFSQKKRYEGGKWFFLKTL